MMVDALIHRPEEGAVLGLPPILLLSAQSRREGMVPRQPQKALTWGFAKSPDEPTEAITPTRNPQST